jgi:hypothetical protein
MRHWVGALAALVFACVHYDARKLMADYIRGKGQVLTEYDKDGSTIYVIRSGPKIRKWVQASDDSAKMLYEIDTESHVCRIGDAEIECDALKDDPDLASYLPR